MIRGEVRKGGIAELSLVNVLTVGGMHGSLDLC